MADRAGAAGAVAGPSASAATVFRVSIEKAGVAGETLVGEGTGTAGARAAEGAGTLIGAEPDWNVRVE